MELSFIHGDIGCLILSLVFCMLPSQELLGPTCSSLGMPRKDFLSSQKFTTYSLFNLPNTSVMISATVLGEGSVLYLSHSELSTESSLIPCILTSVGLCVNHHLL